MGCNLMCRICQTPMDPTSDVIRCTRCGTMYDPDVFKNGDLKFIDGRGDCHKFPVRSEDLVGYLGLSQRFIIKRAVDVLMSQYGLSEDEADDIVREKILGYV